ncbi:MAG: RNA 2',3'-cyclic phosphodiesterase [Nitriliruptoraceae bacterium]
MTRRVFVAIGVPTAVRDALAAATAGLRAPQAALRATAPAGWHLTLAFLGDLEDEQQELAAVVTREVLARDAPRPAPWLALAAADRFGDRVLVVPVSEDPPGALAGLVARLREELTAVGFALPEASFRPHVTLARARRNRPVTRADVAALTVPDRRWQPATVGLWAAARAGGPRPYEVLAELAWPAGPPPAGGD